MISCDLKESKEMVFTRLNDFDYFDILINNAAFVGDLI